MSGKNPYLKPPDTTLPTRPYKIKIGERVIDVNELPSHEPGLPGSLLSILLANGVDIEHACGGVLACSTCHVYVKKGGGSCNEASEDEEDMLDSAPAILPSSRLSCQCVPDGTRDIEVEIPAWNRNAVREGH